MEIYLNGLPQVTLCHLEMGIQSVKTPCSLTADPDSLHLQQVPLEGRIIFNPHSKAPTHWPSPASASTAHLETQAPACLLSVFTAPKAP